MNMQGALQSARRHRDRSVFARLTTARRRIGWNASEGLIAVEHGD